MMSGVRETGRGSYAPLGQTGPETEHLQRGRTLDGDDHHTAKISDCARKTIVGTNAVFAGAVSGVLTSFTVAKIAGVALIGGALTGPLGLAIALGIIAGAVTLFIVGWLVNDIIKTINLIDQHKEQGATLHGMLHSIWGERFRQVQTLFGKTHYNEIYQSESGNKLYLGAILNDRSSDRNIDAIVRELRKDDGEHPKPVLIIDITEGFETDFVHSNFLYPNTEALPEGVTHRKLVVRDHNHIDLDTLDGISREIVDALQSGHVYVHCKAGKGRSGQAVAAALMRLHPSESADDAVAEVAARRPGVTIVKEGKRDHLRAFHRALHASL